MLILADIDFAILLGIMSGFFIIIPIIGILTASLISIFICLLSYGVDYHLFYVIVIYVIGYSLECYLLTPLIIGDKIGLHPVWMILAVLFFGSIYGITGIFFAIPLAGICKILAQFAIGSYKNSELYRNDVANHLKS